MSRRATAALWVFGAALFGARLYVALSGRGGDFRMVWRSLVSFVTNGLPYHNRYFPYPPSSLVLLGGFGLLPFGQAHTWFVLLDAACILLGGAFCLALLRVPWRSPTGALMLIAIGLFAPVTQTLNAANVNGLVFAGQAGAMALAARGRFRQAAVPLGLALAVKPLLLPLVPLWVLARQWAALAITLAVPLALSVPALLVIADGAMYLDRIVPCPRGFSPENVALAGAAGSLRVSALALPLRLAVGAAAAWALVRLWRRPHLEPGVALAEVAGVVLVSTFLLSCYAWPYYGLYLLPTLATAVRPGAAVRRWPAALAAYGIGGPDIRLWLLAGELGDTLAHLRVTAGFLLLLLALGLGPTRSRPSSAP